MFDTYQSPKHLVQKMKTKFISRSSKNLFKKADLFVANGCCSDLSVESKNKKFRPILNKSVSSYQICANTNNNCEPIERYTANNSEFSSDSDRDRWF